MSLCKCPICGESKRNLTKHVNMKHHLSKEEFLKEYPGTKLISDETSNKISESLRNNWKDDNYREKCSVYWRSEEHGRKVSERLRKLWSEDHDSQVNHLQGGITPEVRRGRSIRMKSLSKSLWKSSSYINNHRMLGRKQMLKNMNDPKFHRARVCSYNGTNYRSSWEVNTARVLDEFSIDYRYESFRFPYYVDGIMHMYVPDFYLPDYNFILEVKPANLVEDTIVQLKKDCIPTTYHYDFITTPFSAEIIDKLIDIGVLS